MAPPIRSASASCRRAESKFACAFLRRRAESPGNSNNRATTTAQQRGYVAESIIKYYAYFASSNIAFFLPSFCLCVCVYKVCFISCINQLAKYTKISMRGRQRGGGMEWGLFSQQCCLEWVEPMTMTAPIEKLKFFYHGKI